jgi:hypothetical protein
MDDGDEEGALNVAVFIRWNDPHRAERVVVVVNHRPPHASSLFGIDLLIIILRCDDDDDDDEVFFIRWWWTFTYTCIYLVGLCRKNEGPPPTDRKSPGFLPPWIS